MGKAFYSWQIQNDSEIKGTVVRSTTIPEELGRISYLLTDKTGTLTQNEMIFKKIHVGIGSYSSDTFSLISETIQSIHKNNVNVVQPAFQSKMRKPDGWRLWESVKALGNSDVST